MCINIIKFYLKPGDAMRGGFDWELWYKRIPIPRELKPKDLSDPFDSPVMAGGLFAIDREYFAELGYYDAGLEIWGGEQYEPGFHIACNQSNLTFRHLKQGCRIDYRSIDYQS